jgi:exopolysaccharide production protein ExoZ
MDQEKLPGLQLARAAAALGIAYFHSWHIIMTFPADTAWPVLWLRDHGWIAVDFFFAISGFVICMVATSPKFKPVSFMVRRAFRLYPLWIATSFIFLVITNYVGRDARHTGGFFSYSLTLLPTEGFPFYDLGWSLQHELAFYLLASLTVPLFGLRALICVLVLGIAMDHAFALPWYLHQYFSYYGNFLAGIAAFLVYRRAAVLGTIIPIAIGCVALHYTSSRAFYPVGLFCALIGFINLSPRLKSESLGTLLGNASYSIYLIHPLVFSWIYIQLQPPLPPEWTEEFFRYGALIFVCAAAITSWMLFERPMIWLGNRVARAIDGRQIVAAPGVRGAT